MKLIYPKWRKLDCQTIFHLPPHGPVVFAGALPDNVELEFVDETVDELQLEDSPGMVALSIMLTAQLPRAFEIAEHYRRRGITVIAGGISAMLHAEEVQEKVDCLFLGEVEGFIETVLEDFRKGELKPVYDHFHERPPIESVGTARRAILNYKKYNYRGVKMLDLVHASRGCRFNCFPCATPFLGGRSFRPRPYERVVEEIKSIDNNRLFIVDNSLSQDKKWEEGLFKALIPLKKKWVSHPIDDDDDLLDLAYRAGAWYVYQAVFDMSDVIRKRIERYHDHGIAVEATVLLGTDNQDMDYIKKLVDFLLEINLDIAEFTIMTPYLHTPVRASMERDDRILSNNWNDYTCDRVVFQPKNMTPVELQDMFYYCWETFYEEHNQEVRMGELFRKVVTREMEDGSYQTRKKPRRKKNYN